MRTIRSGCCSTSRRLSRDFTSLRRSLTAASRLCAVEAVRLQAAANGGRMPESLEAVTIVPVPHDPVTGKPFPYSGNDSAATLIREGPPPSRLKVVYRITPQRTARGSK